MYAGLSLFHVGAFVSMSETVCYADANYSVIHPKKKQLFIAYQKSFMKIPNLDSKLLFFK